MQTGEQAPSLNSDKEVLVLVDDDDNQIGTDTRENCHLGKGKRHRAYVVFLFHDGRILLQQRSREKALFPLYWDVSFTSHVYPGESYYQAAVRKGKQELDAGFSQLTDVYSFVYTAPFGKWSENEYCKLLVGDFDGKIRPNPAEIADVGYSSIRELDDEMKAAPDKYTPWLKIAFDGFMKDQLSRRYLS